MSSENRESALDRLGPHLVWLGLTIVLAVGSLVMLQGYDHVAGKLPHHVAATTPPAH